MSDADEWDYTCEICGKTQACVMGSEWEQRGICGSCMTDQNLCEGSNLATKPFEDRCSRCGVGVGVNLRGLMRYAEVHTIPSSKRMKEKNMATKKTVQPGEKFYAIVSVGWEYNDEYTRQGIEGVTKLYRNKERAEEELDRMNGKWLRTDGKDMCFEREYGDKGAPAGYELIEVEADLSEEE